MERDRTHHPFLSGSAPPPPRRSVWRQRVVRVAFVVLMLWPATSMAAVIDWADWLNGTTSPGLVNGVIANTATVTVTALSVLPSQAGDVPNNEPIYWSPPSTYISAVVTNPPVTADIIKINAAQAYTVTFGKPVTDPVIAIVSLGGITEVAWDFGTTPVALLSQGPGHFGSGTLSVTGSVLKGKEGHGVVQVLGTVTSVTFNMVTFENWVGFTVGVPQVGGTPAPARYHVQLGWDQYPQSEIDKFGVNEFALYEGVGVAACDAPSSLSGEIARVAVTEQTYARTEVPATLSDVVCYELSAEAPTISSLHSNRARVLLSEVVPGQPVAVRFE